MIQQVEMDVLTLDLKMPGMNGIETLKEIRMISPDVMVIIITGYGTLKTAIEAIRYGVFDYIPNLSMSPKSYPSLTNPFNAEN